MGTRFGRAKQESEPSWMIPAQSVVVPYLREVNRWAQGNLQAKRALSLRTGATSIYRQWDDVTSLGPQASEGLGETV